MPPSGVNTDPVQKLASSDSRKQIGAAISSGAATRFCGVSATTCAARAGVIGLTRSLAVEWAPLDIRVNCIAPGSISTEGLAVYPPEASARLRDANPLRRLGDPWDIAEGVVYLSASSGNFITGELLAIDGGFQMWGNPWPGGVPDHFNVV